MKKKDMNKERERKYLPAKPIKGQIQKFVLKSRDIPLNDEEELVPAGKLGET